MNTVNNHKIEYDYLCDLLAKMTGLQVRLYRNEQKLSTGGIVVFEPDLLDAHSSFLTDSEKSTGFYISPEFLIFGYVNSKEKGYKIVIGPTSQLKPTSNDIFSLLRSINEKSERHAELKSYFDNINAYSLELFLNILCSINYFINNERFTTTDLIMNNEIETLVDELVSMQKKEYREYVDQDAETHNTYAYENKMLSFVKAGDVDGLTAFLNEPLIGRIGKIGLNSLRQSINSLICAATIVTRAAIKGGLDYEHAFQLSDIYIQKAENMRDINAISALSGQMVFDFTSRVSKAKMGGVESTFISRITQFVTQNISGKISVEMIAEELGVNTTHLCEKFKRHTGKTLKTYITGKKIEEAKRLLEFTDKPLSDISYFLAFSSQSHFQNTFKNQTGTTPNEYRESHT